MGTELRSRTSTETPYVYYGNYTSSFSKFRFVSFRFVFRFAFSVALLFFFLFFLLSGFSLASLFFVFCFRVVFCFLFSSLEISIFGIGRKQTNKRRQILEVSFSLSLVRVKVFEI